MKRRLLMGRLFIKRFNRFFFTTVLGGVLVVLPITLLFFFLRMAYRFIIGFAEPISRLFDFTENIQAWIADLIAFGLIIVVFFSIGLFVRTQFGKQTYHFIETNWLSRIPFYSTLRDTVQTIFGGKKMPFRKVVLVDVFNTGARMTGFVSEDYGNGNYTIFVPTGPNPTNGFIFHVKEEQLEFINVKPEDAMRTIVGVGLGSDILFAK